MSEIDKFIKMAKQRGLKCGVRNQSNKNILLSKNARMNSNPQLVINADDVKCSHGSSTGEIDLAASTIQSYKIFYETSGAGCPNSSTFDLAVTAAGIANNYSMSFDGTNDYIDVGNFSLNASAGTVSAWIKTSGASDFQMIVSKSNGGAGSQLQFRTNADGVFRVILNHSSSVTVIDSVTSPFSPGDIVNSSVSSAIDDVEQSPFVAGSYSTTLAV